MKRVAVIIRRSPFNSVVASEALRMSVGLTLKDNKISVILLDDGIYLLTDLKPELIESQEIEKHIETLLSLGMDIIADEDSVSKRGVNRFKYEGRVLPTKEVLRIIRESEVIISY